MTLKCDKKILSRINECFLSLGADPVQNIHHYVALCGELLKATCALYNRLDRGLLFSMGQWNIPSDYNPVDKPDGHICYDVIKRGGDKIFVVRNLPATDYARTDPNVVRYGLKTYIGKAVKWDGHYVGSLCVVYQHDFDPSETDKMIMGILASAIGAEEYRLRAEEEIRSLARFPAENPYPVFEIGEDGIIRYANPASKPILDTWGRTPGQPVPDDWQQIIKEVRASKEGREIEVRYAQKVFSLLLVPVTDSRSIYIYGRDITERKRAEEILTQQAMHDSLTGLYNRRYFNQRIKEEMKRAERSNQCLAILLCNLDNFQQINDTHSHQTGDEVLVAVAKKIQDATRGADLVFRWGGDEFLVVLSETTRQGTLTAASRIREGALKLSKNMGYQLDLSIGIALYPEHGANINELIRLANRALYIAKKGGDKIHIGEEEYRVDEDAVRVVFQPVVDVHTNQILGYEALSRDPQAKMEILDLFKRYEAVGQLTELKRLCFKLQIKKAIESALKRVFINVDFKVLSQTEPQPKPPEMEVILEISEAEKLFDIESALKVTTKWRQQGYKFAIDDFGAGFISLSFVSQLIPEYIKMDRSTILQSVRSESFRTFLRDLILALRNYSSEGIIAEGIETEKEFQVATDMGVYLFQGFLLGKPQELK